MDIENLIVIVTYNSQDFIEDCIKSIAASDIKKCFLAVIDNNSSDGTLEKLASVEESLRASSGNQSGELNYKFISLKKNIGFSAAVNYCVFKFFLKQYPKAAKNTEFLILINPDVCGGKKRSFKSYIDFWKSIRDSKYRQALQTRSNNDRRQQNTAGTGRYGG